MKSIGTNVVPWCRSWKYACWPFVPTVPQTISPVGASTGEPFVRTDLPLLSISSCCRYDGSFTNAFA